MTRRLVSTRRAVPESGRSLYDELWSGLERLAANHGFHAWRFRSDTSATLFIEFLEFAGTEDPRSFGEVAELLDSLRSAFPSPPPAPSAEEEWIAP